MGIRVTKQQMIELIKCCGQSLIDRAEDIVGGFDGVSEIDIDISLESNMDEAPSICVRREYFPAEVFNYVSSERWVVDGRMEEQK